MKSRDLSELHFPFMEPIVVGLIRRPFASQSIAVIWVTKSARNEERLMKNFINSATRFFAFVAYSQQEGGDESEGEGERTGYEIGEG